MKKPQTAEGYLPEDLARVRSAALTLATYLDDFRDDLLIVGGLVPSLLIRAPMEAHVGTLDLDVGMSLALLHDSRLRRSRELTRVCSGEVDHLAMMAAARAPAPEEVVARAS